MTAALLAELHPRSARSPETRSHPWPPPIVCGLLPELGNDGYTAVARPRGRAAEVIRARQPRVVVPAPLFIDGSQSDARPQTGAYRRCSPGSRAAGRLAVTQTGPRVELGARSENPPARTRAARRRGPPWPGELLAILALGVISGAGRSGQGPVATPSGDGAWSIGSRCMMVVNQACRLVPARSDEDSARRVRVCPAPGLRSPPERPVNQMLVRVRGVAGSWHPGLPSSVGVHSVPPLFGLIGRSRLAEDRDEERCTGAVGPHADRAVRTSSLRASSLRSDVRWPPAPQRFVRDIRTRSRRRAFCSASRERPIRPKEGGTE